LGAHIIGISLDLPSNPSHFEAVNLTTNLLDLRFDIRNNDLLEEVIKKYQPDFVFHLAAQALVKKSYNNPLETWSTNVMGTLNVLNSLRVLKKRCAAVIITSDKCYDNVEWVWGYRETDSLGGPDPYSASKGAAELAIKSYIKSFFQSDSNVRIASARAGNVIGGGDWALDRIVPDCVKAWSNNEKVKLRNPHSTRPWQHVLEPLSGYLNLAISLYHEPGFHGESFNFGPKTIQNHSVKELVIEMSKYWNKVNWEDISTTQKEPYESGLLKLNCDKALFYMNWHSVMDFYETVRFTAEWYRNYYLNSEKIIDTTVNQILEYTEMGRRQNLLWTN
jgi:CDP-glucose 4,6-dehydratase